MLIRRSTRQDIPSSDITPEALYRSRRRFVAEMGLAGLAFLSSGCSEATESSGDSAPKSLDITARKALAGGEAPTPYEDVTAYNNFYEFGTGKTDPAENAQRMKTRPWEVAVEGECEAPGTIGVDDLLSAYPIEERIYRLRCVEAWSMVVPWAGFPLGPMLQRFKPTSKAKYVQLFTYYDPKVMPGARYGILDWPYREGLRIDEAMHPLTLMAVGLYGKLLPNQNGAPLRLVVPWKYGFKSIKSIVRIVFTEEQPRTTWSTANPREYGFYSNVNPKVSHPRWSQARERRIGELFKRDTLMFNGYEDEVASLYAGMDLKTYY